MLTPYSIYIVLIILAFMCAAVTWKARYYFLKNASNAWVPTTVFVNIALENCYYFYARIIDDGMRSEILWFLPGILIFKFVYIFCFARLIFDRKHDACKKQ